MVLSASHFLIKPFGFYSVRIKICNSGLVSCSAFLIPSFLCSPVCLGFFFCAFPPTECFCQVFLAWYPIVTGINQISTSRVCTSVDLRLDTHSMYMITPRAQQSTGRPYLCLPTTSGAKRGTKKRHQVTPTFSVEQDSYAPVPQSLPYSQHHRDLGNYLMDT